VTSELVGGEWPTSRTGLFTPGERFSGICWLGGLVGPRAGLDYMEKEQFLTIPGLELGPIRHQARSQSLYRLYYRPVIAHEKREGVFRFSDIRYVSLAVKVNKTTHVD
jgi:hypothetical protein